MTSIGMRETRDLLRGGSISVVEHTESVLATIAQTDPLLHAFISVAERPALQAAEAADARIRRLGQAAWRDRPLLGVPVAVKDLIQTRDLPTTRGSLLPNNRSRFDAPAVARLRAAGAIVVGKTTTSEFGWSASTVSRVAPSTRNPWNRSRSAGGSSGGSAAAVAAGLCSAALGTDGAGSVRIPAAFCGVVGYKPSFGRIPYVPPCADRLAHLGTFTRTVPDAIELAAVMSGPHQDDPDSAHGAREARREPESLRIGWLEFPGTSPEVRRVSEQTRAALTVLGHRPEEIAVPFDDPYPALVDIIAAAEAASTPPQDEELSDPGRVVVVRHGRQLSGATVMRAEQVRLALRSTLHMVMSRYDLLAMATVPIEPFDADATGPEWACDLNDLRWLAWSPACYPFNLSGQPAISLPAGLTCSGLPVGLQLVGPAGADELLLGAACHIEAALGLLPALPDPRTERMV